MSSCAFRPSRFRLPPRDVRRNSPATSAASRNVAAIFFVLPTGSAAQSPGPQAESIRTTPYFRTPRSFSFCAMAQAFRTCPTNALRSASVPMADPPPVGGHTGATIDPINRPRFATESRSFLRSSSVESISVCGSDRNKSTPSNLTPSTSAAAVRSSIVSRSMGGSAPGPSPPLPTRPGHIALCTAGYLCMRVISFSATIRHRDCSGQSASGSRGGRNRSC